MREVSGVNPLYQSLGLQYRATYLQGHVSQFDRCVKEVNYLSGEFHSEFYGIRSGVQIVYKFVQFLRAVLPNG